MEDLLRTAILRSPQLYEFPKISRIRRRTPHGTRFAKLQVMTQAPFLHRSLIAAFTLSLFACTSETSNQEDEESAVSSKAAVVLESGEGLTVEIELPPATNPSARIRATTKRGDKAVNWECSLDITLSTLKDTSRSEIDCQDPLSFGSNTDVRFSLRPGTQGLEIGYERPDEDPANLFKSSNKKVRGLYPLTVKKRTDKPLNDVLALAQKLEAALRPILGTPMQLTKQAKPAPTQFVLFSLFGDGTDPKRDPAWSGIGHVSPDDPFMGTLRSKESVRVLGKTASQGLVDPKVFRDAFLKSLEDPM